jgi:SAM-dependent methyltransferase
VRLLTLARAAMDMVRVGRLDDLMYKIAWRTKGLDLYSVGSLDALGLRAELSHWYSDSGGPTLLKVFRSLPITCSDRIVDLGSGKGGAAITLSALGFAEVMGVDISPDLVRVAEKNVSRLRLSNIHFICTDAAEWTDIDRFTYLYLYNPFPCNVLVRVLSNVRQSLMRRPRRLMMVYQNPLCDEIVVSSGLFVEIQSVKPRGHSLIRVYEHEGEAHLGNAAT